MPVEHLDAQLHDIVPKAQDEERIAYLKSMPSGTANAEAQYFGHGVASGTLNLLSEPEAITYTVGLLAPAAFNTAWYSGAQAATAVQRRRLKLPRFDVDATIKEPVSFWSTGRAQMAGSLLLADTIARETRDQLPRLNQTKRLYMAHLGNAAMALACSQLSPELFDEASAYDAQLLARSQSLRMLSASRELGQLIGRHPSLKQLADTDSYLSVHIRRTAPKAAKQAFKDAYVLREMH